MGRRRSGNEDSFGLDAELGVLVIADGMGGHERGEIASTLAVDTVLEFLQHGLAVPPNESQELDLLRNAAVRAHRRVLLENENHDGRAAMGSTLIVAALENGLLHFAHVGDSRLYVISASGDIEQLTRDQTLGQQMRDKGEDPIRITAHEDSTLLQAVGLEGFVVPATGTWHFGADDTLLLCTDGLSDLVSEEQIAATIVAHRNDLEATADHLVARANAAGGYDNITVVLAHA